MLKLRAVIVSFLLLGVSLYGGSAKYTLKADVAPIPVLSKSSGFYIGFGVGNFKLKDSYTKERLTSTTATIIVGYDFNKYISLEGRFVRSLHNLDYSKKATTALSSRVNSTFSNFAIYGKIGYQLNNIKPYILIGYGENRVTNLAAITRQESGVQYGVGISYKFNNHWKIFTDYIQNYNDKGFDGRAKLDSIKIHTLTVGINYHF